MGKRVRGTTNFTPVIPKFYWDVETQEQRIKLMCYLIQELIEQLDDKDEQVEVNKNAIATINEYLDYLKSKNVDLWADKLEEVRNDLQGQINDLNLDYISLRELLTKLKVDLEHIITNMKVYDPTKGKFTSSVDANRRMLQLLSNPVDELLNCNEVSKLTVADAAEYKCGEYVNQAFNRVSEIPYQNTTAYMNVDVHKLTTIKLTTGKLGDAPEVVSEVSI